MGIRVPCGRSGSGRKLEPVQRTQVQFGVHLMSVALALHECLKSAANAHPSSAPDCAAVAARLCRASTSGRIAPN
jgi:hypothetical protein